MTFELDQKVRIVNTDQAVPGTEGVIINVDSEDVEWPFEVQWTGEEGAILTDLFSEDELEAIE